MLDPKKPIALLPQDREIMDITGLDEKSYRQFVLQCYKAGRFQPGEPVAFDLLTFAVTLVVGLALSYVASLLTPRPSEDEGKEQRNVGGQRITNGQRSAPTSGFDSTQNVVEIASTVQLVYANRREIDGIYYGGVRVNTNLLWSQIQSYGNGQLLRGIFLVGEGITPQPNMDQLAIGNQLINNFDLTSDNTSRVALYYVDGSEEDNRIVSDDYVAGRTPATDVGNAENYGADDVFQVRGTGTSYVSDFCMATTPSNQTTFGVYGFIGNNFPFRLSPDIRATENYDSEPTTDNQQSKADRRKDNKRYCGRAGIEGDVDQQLNLVVDQEVIYTIYPESDSEGRFEYTTSGVTAEAYCKDVASSIASRQNSYDDQLIEGETYLIGTAKGVCIQRTPRQFESEVANVPIGGGQQVQATFKITEPGYCWQWREIKMNPGFKSNNEPEDADPVTATSHPHIMRMAEAYISVERACRYIELGIRSNVQLNLNGICNYRDVAIRSGSTDITRTLEKMDDDARNENIVFRSGTFTSPENRYSFFKVSYRLLGDTNYIDMQQYFAVKSLSSSSVYNYLRFEMPSDALWEIKLTPVSGYEARALTQPINVLDYKESNNLSVTQDGFTVWFTGVANVARNISNFGVPILTTIDGNEISGDFTLEFDQDNSGRGFFSDAFARMAESFMHNEITTSATNPEHEVVYLNTQTTNTTVPNYANLAMLGMNIRSSKAVSQLQQVSVYCNQGIGSTSNFPEVLLDLLTNDRYGTGSVLNAEQIDTDSFTEATAFCESRRYFFDGVLDSKVNIRSWGAATANNFLLDLVIRNGKFALQPVCAFDAPADICQLFTSGNIIQDSFEMSYADEQDRIPPRVSIRWRDERPDSEGGLFPVVRQITVREADTPESAPLESIDISDYATSEQHAIDLGKYICRSRRLITHSVSFTTTPTQAALDIGSTFKLGMETVTYEQPGNGAIDADGTVTSWPPLADGTYDVLTWSGKNECVLPADLTISNGKANLSSCVFCIRNAVTFEQTYKCQSIAYNEEGNIAVEATVYPTNVSGLSLLVQGWDIAESWVIEGQVYS